jgi:protein-S-isoprenylcysteine O-methyltransferase Ste14
MFTTQIIFIIIGSLGLLLVSRSSLRNPTAHGFYRFFAWEAILLLFVSVLPFWFVDPFSWNQVISWILLVVSLIPLSWGLLLLKNKGKPAGAREIEGSLLPFERTSSLVTTGIYRFIRHPLYSSLLSLAWGIFFKLPSFMGFALALTASGFLYRTAIADERECILFFGEEYAAYMTRTKRFIPFIF